MDQLDDMLCFFPWVLVLLPSIVVAEFVEAEESAMLKLSVLLRSHRVSLLGFCGMLDITLLLVYRHEPSCFHHVLLLMMYAMSSYVASRI